MAKRRKEYNRIRGDSGQHRRILAVMALLGVIAFIPTALRLYQLIVSEYEYY